MPTSGGAAPTRRLPTGTSRVGPNPPYRFEMEGRTTFHFVTGGIHEALDRVVAPPKFATLRYADVLASASRSPRDTDRSANARPHSRPATDASCLYFKYSGDWGEGRGAGGGRRW